MTFKTGKPNVFLSYRRTECHIARLLRDRLEQEVPEVQFWQDITDEEGGESWWRQITEALDTVDDMILILTEASAKSPVVQKEWRYARQSGVRIHPVWGETLGPAALHSLPRWISKTHIYDLEAEWPKFINYLRGPGRATRVPFMAPDLPRNFVPRPDKFNQISRSLLEGEAGNPVASTTALYGSGGFGKTTLAISVCHDDRIIAAFDDGVLWVSLNQEPRMLNELSKLYRALTGTDPGFRDIEEATIQLASRLEDKTCLIVIDDVWAPAHLKPFLRGGKSCARLITTRQFEVAARTETVPVDEMSIDQSVQLLTASLPAPPADPAPYRALAHRAGECPLMLDLLAAALHLRIKRGDSADGAIDYVNRSLDKKGITAFDRRNPQERQGLWPRPSQPAWSRNCFPMGTDNAASNWPSSRRTRASRCRKSALSGGGTHSIRRT